MKTIIIYISLLLSAIFLMNCQNDEGSSAASGSSSGSSTGSGGSSGSSTTQYAFVTSFIFNAASGQVIVFRKNADNCGFTQLATYAVGRNAFDLAYDFDGFLYVGNDGDGDVSMFSFDKSNGTLTDRGRVNQSSNGDASVPYGIAIHPSGFVYIADGSRSGSLTGSIGLFNQNSTTGVLTAQTPAFLNTGGQMYFPVLSTNGNYLYVTRYDTDQVYQYSVNSSTGALSALGTATIASGNQPWEIVAHPSGNYIYVTNHDADNSGTDSISQYSINSSTGQLSQIATAVTSGNNPIGLAVNQNFLFAGSFGNNVGTVSGGVYGYSINQSTGALTATAQGSVALAAPGVYGLQLDRDGRCLYVARSNYNTTSAGGDITIYNVNTTTGELTLHGNIAAGNGPRFIKMAW